jgi:hypothetical protein
MANRVRVLSVSDGDSVDLERQVRARGSVARAGNEPGSCFWPRMACPVRRSGGCRLLGTEGGAVAQPVRREGGDTRLLAALFDEQSHQRRLPLVEHADCRVDCHRSN